jgi:hypothetical protein
MTGKRRPWVRSLPTSLVSTTWSAMFPSSSKIVGTTTTGARRQMGQRGLIPIAIFSSVMSTEAAICTAPDELRSAYRKSGDGTNNDSFTSFHVARTLSP